MANYNIELNRWNGSAYDQLLPKNTISGSGSPTTSTVGIVGQFYIDTSTSPKEIWQCLNDSGGVYSWTKNYSAEELLSDTTAALINTLSGATPSTPNDALAAITQKVQTLFDGRVQIATGSYTGTGTSGASNPNSLTFDFLPKIVVFMGPLITSSNLIQNFYPCVIPFAGFDAVLNGQSFYYNPNYDFTVTVNPGNKSMTWYGTSETKQWNEDGLIYRYYAIG